ncbi:RNA polymerase sigma factor SigJ [Azospirillum sp. TSO22-1]|uniref:RNA polymerase sigma factor SigJ n=1 Tax=Azospirillum sp. TSO22-1 TaxID=716789 RepID=UPI000D608E22|nr:RNA polymerase sigma factor SigJ [Azospirillum sp. TSO22-1]PWC53930.1 RNA polymerase subunit sigma-70 [Azospirillum sp. TSO22-1]
MTLAADDRSLDLFVAERPRLRALAYRMLGSLSDADDVVQDAWLRWAAADTGAVDSPRAFLTTLTARLALDRLRAAKASRETYVGQWLPEPAVTPEGDAPGNADEPEGSVPLALLVLLERLGPEQRAVYVLREAMDLDYAEIAGILGRSAEGCRQIMRRARAALEGPVRFPADGAGTRALADAFAQACASLDYGRIVALFSQDAVLLADGGGVARSAFNPIRGPDRIARFFLGVQRKRALLLDLVPVRVNGGPGFALRRDGDLIGVMGVDAADGLIRRLYLIVNPRKLRTEGLW